MVLRLEPRGSTPPLTTRIPVTKLEWSYGMEKFKSKISYILDAIAK